MSKTIFKTFSAVYMAAALRIVGEVHAHAVCFLLLPPPDNLLNKKNEHLDNLTLIT